MGQLIEFPGNLKFALTDCASCGLKFALPQTLERQRRNDGDTFFCPNGHGLHFPKVKTDGGTV